MAEIDRLDRGWQKSTRSGAGSNECVEVLVTRDLVLVRDSKDPNGPVLAFSGSQWTAFIGAVKDGSL
jgi:Domain of unknown function (DUF397)